MGNPSSLNFSFSSTSVSCRQLFLGHNVFLVYRGFHLRAGRKSSERGGGGERNGVGGGVGRERRKRRGNRWMERERKQETETEKIDFHTNSHSKFCNLWYKYGNCYNSYMYRYVTYLTIHHCVLILQFGFLLSSKKGLLSYLNVCMMPSPVAFLIAPAQ